MSSPFEILVSPAPTPAVSGLQLVCDDDIADYATQENTGSTYDWNVTGGSIIGGAGTYQVSVHWGSPGTGTISVSETNANNCTSLSEDFEVTIDNCTGIDENDHGFFRVFPNPASNYLNIDFDAAQAGKCRLSILNILGHIMYTDHNISIQSDHSLRINLEDYPEGIYIIRILTDQNVICQKKIIKVN